jgi:hypothetical protein
MLTGKELVELLGEIKAEVERGGSLEGTLRYRAAASGTYVVVARVRVGNQMGQGGMIVVEGEAPFVEGWTRKGRYVRIEGDPYTERGKSKVWIDGEVVEPTSVQRLRDGGTTIIETKKGNIVKPNRLGSTPTPPLFDGETLDPEPEEVF